MYLDKIIQSVSDAVNGTEISITNYKTVNHTEVSFNFSNGSSALVSKDSSFNLVSGVLDSQIISRFKCAYLDWLRG